MSNGIASDERKEFDYFMNVTKIGFASERYAILLPKVSDTNI